MAKITPWKVTGRIDYYKLIKKFGTKKISSGLYKELEKIGGKNIFLERHFFYSHRDLHVLLKEFKKGKSFFLYTGRAPSGPMHIGHLIPFLMSKWLQKSFKVNLYIQLPDEEKFLAKQGSETSFYSKWVKDNLLDIAALNFDKNKTFAFLNTEFIGNYYKLACRIAKKINYSTAKAVFGFNNQSNIGIMFYPSLQIAVTMFEKKRCLIPAAIDQDPYWRIQRDIAEGLGFYKASAIHSKFVPPLTGIKGKMSSSIKETAVYLNDSPEIVKQKINKHAFSGGQPSIAEHRKKGGNTKIDVSFQWLKIMFEPDNKKLKEIEKAYSSGEMLTGELKAILIKKINDFLKEHQKKKKKAEKSLNKIMYDGKLAQKMWNSKL